MTKNRNLPPGAMEGIRKGVQALKEGRVTSWEDVKEELGIKPVCTPKGGHNKSAGERDD